MLQQDPLESAREGVPRYPGTPRPEQPVQTFGKRQLLFMARHFFLADPEQLLALAQVKLATNEAGRQRGARRQRAGLHANTE